VPVPTPPPPPTPPTPIPCTWISGAGLKGGDIDKTDAKTKEECCASCWANSKCKAACFRPPTHTGPGATGCHMKSALSTDPGGQGDKDAVVCVPKRP
jgi:hypothetical protein